MDSLAASSAITPAVESWDVVVSAEQSAMKCEEPTRGLVDDEWSPVAVRDRCHLRNKYRTWVLWMGVCPIRIDTLRAAELRAAFSRK